VSAISCGTHTNNGLSADATAITEAARRGKDLRSHRTTRWEDVELTANDVIVAMQLRHAISALPRARKEGCQILLFSSLLREFGVIWDPYGGHQEEYSRTFDLIEDGIQFIKRRLNARHQGRPGEQ
jgi:protein-tyrosine-phosphatase